MQLLSSQICFPRLTASVILSSLVCEGIWRMESTVSARKAAVKTPVPEEKDCGLFLA